MQQQWIHVIGNTITPLQESGCLTITCLTPQRRDISGDVDIQVISFRVLGRDGGHAMIGVIATREKHACIILCAHGQDCRRVLRIRVARIFFWRQLFLVLVNGQVPALDSIFISITKINDQGT